MGEEIPIGCDGELKMCGFPIGPVGWGHPAKGAEGVNGPAATQVKPKG
jgi:hypothetical protein